MNLTEKEECDIIGSIEEKKESQHLKDITKGKKISGIYKIINKTNGKYYVGSSNDIIGRWFTHKSQLNRNNHCNPHLQRAWNKYGKDNFEFIIVEEKKK